MAAAAAGSDAARALAAAVAARDRAKALVEASGEAGPARDAVSTSRRDREDARQRHILQSPRWRVWPARSSSGCAVPSQRM